MDWVEIKIENILAHMPTDVKIRYDAWLADHPEKAGRLFELMDNALHEFRDNLVSVPENVVDPRETWVPQSAVRHLETIVLFTLAMEMGLPIDSAAIGARYSADIFLRQILMGRYTATTEEGGSPTPRFSIPSKNGSGRSLGILLALILFAQQALGGWIRPSSGPQDTDVATTFIPSAYSISTATLFDHLHGINAALGPLATTAYVQEAVAAVSITNTVDATARALASAASVAANAAMHSFDAYTKTDVVIPSEPRWTGAAPSKKIKFITTQGASTWTNELRAGAYPGDPQADSANLWWNGAKVHVGDFVSFPAGDCLTGDGTNLFYVNAAKTITNQLTGN